MWILTPSAPSKPAKHFAILDVKYIETIVSFFPPCYLAEGCSFYAPRLFLSHIKINPPRVCAGGSATTKPSLRAACEAQKVRSIPIVQSTLLRLATSPALARLAQQPAHRRRLGQHPLALGKPAPADQSAKSREPARSPLASSACLRGAF
jgi:hypothetical protein